MSLLTFINEYDRTTYVQATKEYERTALFRLFSLVGCFGLQLCQTEFDTAHLMVGRNPHWGEILVYEKPDVPWMKDNYPIKAEHLLRVRELFRDITQ